MSYEMLFRTAQTMLYDVSFKTMPDENFTVHFYLQTAVMIRVYVILHAIPKQASLPSFSRPFRVARDCISSAA
jgi:hypothetical protein